MDKVDVPSANDRVLGLISLEYLEGKQLRRDRGIQFKTFKLDKEMAISTTSGQHFAVYSNALLWFCRSFKQLDKAVVAKIMPEMGSLFEKQEQLNELQALDVQISWQSKTFAETAPDTAKMSYYEKERAGRLDEFKQQLAPVESRIMATLDKDGVAVLPSGPQGHVIITQVKKLEDGQYEVSEFNAGYGTKDANKFVVTSEDVSSNKRGVFGKRTWNVSPEALPAVLDLYLQRRAHKVLDYDYITSKLESALGKPAKEGITHVQDEPNCSTRTSREFLRDGLTPAVFDTFMKFMQTQFNVSVEDKIIRASVPDVYLGDYFSKALQQLSPRSSATVMPLVPDSWSIKIFQNGMPDEMVAKFAAIAKSVTKPTDPVKLTEIQLKVSTKALQGLFDDLHKGLSAPESFDNFFALVQQQHSEPEPVKVAPAGGGQKR